VGWFQRQFRRLALRAAKYAGIPLRDPALVAMLGSQPTSSGVDVDNHEALNYSAVWAAVNLISSNVAALPAVPYERRKNGHYEAQDHPAWSLLLVCPNMEYSPYTWRETITAHAIVWGNGYSELDKEYPDDIASEATILQPNQVAPMRDEDTGEVYYQFTALYSGEEDRRIPWWKVFHLPGLGFDGIKGYDVIQHARESIGLGMAAEKFGGAFFGRGCTLGGILETPEELQMTDKARKNLRESFELLHRGPDNSHRIAILEQGMSYKQLGVPPETAQFLETRKFQVTEIARWFRVPPHKIGDLDRATFTNIEHQSIEFLQDTLRPWLIRWEQECARKLFGPVDQTRYFVCHDTHNLLMTDVNARYDAYAKGRNGGWLTLNDILKREGKNPLPPEIGDSRLAPSTMKVLGAHGDPVDPDAVLKVMNLLAAMYPIAPDDALQLISAMLPGIPDDAAKAMLRRLPDYKPPVNNASTDD
jgi:HK97 family phage portal protein